MCVGVLFRDLCHIFISGENKLFRIFLTYKYVAVHTTDLGTCVKSVTIWPLKVASDQDEMLLLQVPPSPNQ